MGGGELFPIFCGLSFGAFASGAFASWLRPSWRKPSLMFATLLLAFVSCSINGELQTSRAFLLADTLLVALSTSVGYTVEQRLRQSKSAVLHQDS